MRIRWFGLVLILILSFSSILLAKDAQQYFVEGNMYFNKGEYDQAIIMFKKAIAEDEDFAPAYYNIGVVYHHKGKPYYPIAAKWYKKALEKNNKLTNAYYNLGVIHFSLDKYEQALDYFQKAKELNPKDSTIQKALDLTNQEIAKMKKKMEEEEKKVEEKEEKEKSEVKKEEVKIVESKKEISTKPKEKKKIKTQKKKVEVKIKKVEPILSVRKEKKVKTKSKYLGDITFCREVKNRQPISRGDVFTSQDEKVVLWINLINLWGKHILQTKWYDPKNHLQFDFKYPFESLGDRYRFWVEKNIAGTSIAGLKGEWKVVVLLDKQEITKVHFILK